MNNIINIMIESYNNRNVINVNKIKDIIDLKNIFARL